MDTFRGTPVSCQNTNPQIIRPSLKVSKQFLKTTKEGNSQVRKLLFMVWFHHQAAIKLWDPTMGTKTHLELLSAAGLKAAGGVREAGLIPRAATLPLSHLLKTHSFCSNPCPAIPSQRQTSEQAAQPKSTLLMMTDDEDEEQTGVFRSFL